MILLSSHASWARPHIKMYLPTGLQVGVDVGSPLYYEYQKTGPQYELNGLLDFKRLLLQGDYGWGSIQRQGVSKKQGMASICSHQGQYFRIGVDYNFINNSVDDNAAFLGLRYAKSYFQDRLQSVLPDELYQLTQKKDPPQKSAWGNYLINSQQNHMQARWFEIVAGVRVKAWQWCYLGCTARYKFNKKIMPHDGHVPFDVIGWGLNEEDAFGLNVYLILRLPLQKRMFAAAETKEKK
jgi:hypothetical protein